MATLRDWGEFGFIEGIAARVQTRPGVRLGIGDDGAVLESLRAPIVTCDALVEGVHFRRDWMSGAQIGRKTLAVSVSDLAAMGAAPVAAFLTLAAPPDLEAEWIFDFYDGLEAACAQWKCTLAGGDTVSGAQLMVSLTLIGELLPTANDAAILRSGAQIGDVLAVSGTLGDSGAGLHILGNPLASAVLSTPTRDFLVERHANPTPRLELMRALLRADRAAIHAALDLSDGLAGDARHMAKRSGKRLHIEAQRLPLSPQLRDAAPLLGLDALDLALGGGEDYELLLAVAPEKFEALARESGVLTAIGRVEAGEGVEIWQNKTPREVRGAWTHF